MPRNGWNKSDKLYFYSKSPNKDTHWNVWNGGTPVILCRQAFHFTIQNISLYTLSLVCPRKWEWGPRPSTPLRFAPLRSVAPLPLIAGQTVIADSGVFLCHKGKKGPENTPTAGHRLRTTESFNSTRGRGGGHIISTTNYNNY